MQVLIISIIIYKERNIPQISIGFVLLLLRIYLAKQSFKENIFGRIFPKAFSEIIEAGKNFFDKSELTA